MTKQRYCECDNPGCPVHIHAHCQSWEKETVVLYRIDMMDYTGTAMCSPCAADAMESGLFTTRDTEG